MATATFLPETVQLQERVEAGFAVRVDKANGVIHDVRILGRHSKNGREYTREAVAQSIGLYENIHVNLDHPAHAAGDRSVISRIGWLAGVKQVSDGGLRGNLHILTSHPHGPSILEAAEKNPSMLGLSHNAEGRITKHDGKNVVEEITRVRSVDLVADPATASSLFESSYRGSYHTMTSSEFAERLFEADGEGFAPATDPVDRIPVAGDNADGDAKLRKLQRELLDMIQAAMSVDGLLRDLAKLVNDKGLPVLDPSELATAAESVDPYSFAASICENARGVRSPSGRDPSAAFAAALFD